MAIHLVFHVSLLRVHKESDIPGRNQLQPGPIEIEGEEEYVVEKILDSRIFRRHLEYLVKWEGYDNSHVSWEPAANCKHAKQLVDAFHRNHPSAPQRLRATIFEALTFKPMPEPLTDMKARTSWVRGKGKTLMRA